MPRDRLAALRAVSTTTTFICRSLNIDKPESKSQSKIQVQNPYSRIQKGKEEFGLWADSKISSATTTTHNF